MKKIIICGVLLVLFICFSAVNAYETPPAVIKSVSPIYPDIAGLNNTEGYVIVRATITKDGEIIDPEIEESYPEGYFEASALDALKKFEVKPATKNGVPVDSQEQFPFVFSSVESSFDDGTFSNIQAYRHARRGISLVEKREFQRAAEEFSGAINLNSGYVTAYYYRSLSFMEMEEYDKAMADIEQAIRLSGRTWGFYNHRGLIHLLLENYQDAIRDFNRTIRNEPENMMAYIHRGDANRMEENYQEAISDYTSALALNPSLIHVYINRGYSYFMLNDNYNTCNDFKRACELGDCRGFEYMKTQGVCPSDNS